MGRAWRWRGESYKDFKRGQGQGVVLCRHCRSREGARILMVADWWTAVPRASFAPRFWLWPVFLFTFRL